MLLLVKFSNEKLFPKTWPGRYVKHMQCLLAHYVCFSDIFAGSNPDEMTYLLPVGHQKKVSKKYLEKKEKMN